MLNDAGITYRSAYNILVSGTGLNNMEEFDEISDGYTDDDEDDEDEGFSSRREASRPLPVLEREPLNRNPLMIHLFWITSERI